MVCVSYNNDMSCSRTGVWRLISWDIVVLQRPLKRTQNWPCTVHSVSLLSFTFESRNSRPAEKFVSIKKTKVPNGMLFRCRSGSRSAPFPTATRQMCQRQRQSKMASTKTATTGCVVSLEAIQNRRQTGSWQRMDPESASSILAWERTTITGKQHNLKINARRLEIRAVSSCDTQCKVQVCHREPFVMNSYQIEWLNDQPKQTGRLSSFWVNNRADIYAKDRCSITLFILFSYSEDIL